MKTASLTSSFLKRPGPVRRYLMILGLAILWWALLYWVGTPWASGQVQSSEINAPKMNRPWLGLALDANGDLRAVYGVPASTTLGTPVFSGILAAGCSPIVCLAKSATALWSWSNGTDASGVPSGNLNTTTQIDAPSGPALFAFFGNGAYVYFPQTGTLAWWHPVEINPDGVASAELSPVGANKAQVAFVPDGEILSLRAGGDGIDYAVRRNSDVWIEHFSTLDGTISIVNALTANSNSLHGSAQGPLGDFSKNQDSKSDINAVMLLENGTLIADTNGIRLVHSDGTTATFVVPGIRTFTAMMGMTGDMSGTNTVSSGTNGNYAQGLSSNGMWAIRTDEGREQVFLLPGVPSARDFAGEAPMPARSPPARPSRRPLAVPMPTPSDSAPSRLAPAKSATDR